MTNSTVKLTYEIERKFLVKTLPSNYRKYPAYKIKQGYLSISDTNYEIRFRQKGERYFQTIKCGTGMKRGEIEIELTYDQFKKLWILTADKVIKKMRYDIPYEDKIIELDIYRGQLEGLLTAEVEFLTEEESKLFIAPHWFGVELTDDNRYKNRNLAFNGLPSDFVK